MDEEQGQRLARTMEYVETHVKEWNQRNWGEENSCGTAFCLFGHGVNLEGGRFLTMPHPRLARFDYGLVALDSLPEAPFPWDAGLDDGDARIVNGELYISTFMAGARLFGLDERAADKLSEGSNSMEELCTLVARELGTPWRSPWHDAVKDPEREHVIFRYPPECTDHNCTLKWYVWDTQECSEELIEAPAPGPWQVRVITNPDYSRELEWRRPEHPAADS